MGMAYLGASCTSCQTVNFPVSPLKHICCPAACMAENLHLHMTAEGRLNQQKNLTKWWISKNVTWLM